MIVLFELNVFGICVAGVVLAHLIAVTRLRTKEQKLLAALFLSSIFMIAFDTLGRFSGNAHEYYYVLNSIGNFLYYSLFPVPFVIWTAYMCVVLSVNKRVRNIFYSIALSIFVINFVLACVSLCTGWYYFIDKSSNVYYRGPLFFLPVTVTCILGALAFIIVLIYRRRIELKYVVTFELFPALLILGLGAQILLYNVGGNEEGAAVTLFISVLEFTVVYLNTQNQKATADYLTGLNNRSALDLHIQRLWSEKIPFGMFMLDIDNFKKVNDEFGHAIGDSMLKSVASALKKLSSDNKLFCARYGGDEFCVLTKMITRDAEKELEDSIRRACSVDGFDFTVGISIGYVKCDYTVDADAKALFNRADAKMYAEKQGKKRIGAE